MATNLEKKIDELISSVTNRNKQTQEKKQSGPWGWIVGGILALISLVGIGIAMYYWNKRNKELAKAKTELEHQKVDLAQKKHDCAQSKHGTERLMLKRQVEVLAEQIRQNEKDLKKVDDEHAARKAAIEKLRSWEEINAG